MAGDVAAAGQLSMTANRLIAGMEDAMPATADSDVRVDDDDVGPDVEAGDDDSSPDPSADDAKSAPTSPAGRPRSARRTAVFCLAAIVALAATVGWLGFRVHQSHQQQAQRNQFLQVARQGALNLTTINWRQADADVHRILDGGTGEFYNDFARRAQPFIDVLKQAKATTVGSITEAGLESQTADTAQVLVAVSVQTSNAGESDPTPRAWRMRISVQRVGGKLKVSNVGFVP
jgi:Mce-associated membrane protein